MNQIVVLKFGSSVLRSSADLPVPANYRGDGFDLPAIFRSSTGLWSVREFTRAFWGSAGDIPVTRKRKLTVAG